MDSVIINRENERRKQMIGLLFRPRFMPNLVVDRSLDTAKMADLEGRVWFNDRRLLARFICLETTRHGN